MKPTTSHAWIGNFAARLLQLKPGLHPGSAVAFAVQNHDAAHGRSAQMAAEEFATRQVGEIDRVMGSGRVVTFTRRTPSHQQG